MKDSDTKTERKYKILWLPVATLESGLNEFAKNGWQFVAVLHQSSDSPMLLLKKEEK